MEEALRDQMNRWVGDGWLAVAEQMMSHEMDGGVVGRRMEGVPFQSQTEVTSVHC